MLGRRHTIAGSRVHHHYSTLAGDRNIDIVDPGSGPTNHFQIIGGTQNVRRHLCLTADNQSLVTADDLLQLGRGQTNLVVDLKLGVAFQNIDSLARQIIADQYFHKSLS